MGLYIYFSIYFGYIWVDIYKVFNTTLTPKPQGNSIMCLYFYIVFNFIFSI